VTWNCQREDISDLIRDIYFTDPLNGLAVGGTVVDYKPGSNNGGSGIILYTSDGGLTWKTVFKSMKPEVTGK
jgi:photosystem II stability/assembly factor-like uncharacterized protein